MMDSRATNSFVHSEVVQYLICTTVDVLAIRVTLADDSYVDCSTSIPFYLKLSGNLQKSPFGLSETVNVACSALYCVLLNLTSDVVLGMNWLHTINHMINWNNYSLSLVYEGGNLSILGTKSGCFLANFEVYTLKLVLKTMCSNKVLAWFGVLWL